MIGPLEKNGGCKMGGGWGLIWGGRGLGDEQL